jgi:hypothetical protein
MNRKLAVAAFALPFGVSFLLAKSASAAEVAYQPDAQTHVFVAQRYDDPQNHERRDDWRRNEVRGQSFHRNEFHHDDRGVWIPGHYKPGFLGLFRVWVDGHWEHR